MSLHVPERFRISSGILQTTAADGNNGAFVVRLNEESPFFSVIASDGKGWDHVSVSLPHRCPTWDEMCQIKDMFWDPEDCVVQYHPPKSEYVNNHPYCLHLWRNQTAEMVRPPMIMIGFKSIGECQI
jgi:hypothetical protein